jgi:hypothetical protein
MISRRMFLGVVAAGLMPAMAEAENSPIRITSGQAASSENEMDEGYLGIGQKTAIMCEPKSVVHDILRSLNGKVIDLWATVTS